MPSSRYRPTGSVTSQYQFQSATWVVLSQLLAWMSLLSWVAFTVCFCMKEKLDGFHLETPGLTYMRVCKFAISCCRRCLCQLMRTSTQHWRKEVSNRVPTHPWKYLKVVEFFSSKFKALIVLENRTGAWNSWNFIPQVLESPWIHQVKLHDIKNFVKQYLYRTGMCILYLLRNLPGILRNTRFVNNCHVLFLSTKTVS